MKRLALALALICGAAAAWAAESTKERTVTLDVKDEDVRVILKSMQQQCAIKNLLIDKDVSGRGTIYFRQVPCSTAFKVVLRQFGLAGKVETF
ncbi:MAG TPA: hypothetical protein VHK90_18105 [Thermoanaerobaculia bacterium]|nr:hypothetical protein [Thermoanaerobaculia bacterium]